MGTPSVAPRSFRRVDHVEKAALWNPAGTGGVATTVGAVAMAVVVAIIVMAMVSISGGLAHPIVSSPQVAAAAAAPPVQS